MGAVLSLTASVRANGFLSRVVSIEVVFFVTNLSNGAESGAVQSGAVLLRKSASQTFKTGFFTGGVTYQAIIVAATTTGGCVGVSAPSTIYPDGPSTVFI